MFRRITNGETTVVDAVRVILYLIASFLFGFSAGLLFSNFLKSF